MRSSIYSLITLAVLVPVSASAQTSNPDRAAQARIDAALETALEAGIPREMLENKIAEGRAKGVSMTRIAGVIEHRTEVLARVQAALLERRADAAEPRATAAELSAAADAHENGVSLESIAKLSRSAGNDRAVALTVLADIVARGNTAPAHALMRVEAALQGGADALVRLGRTTPNAAQQPPAGATATGSARGEAKAPKAGATGRAVIGVKVGG